MLVHISQDSGTPIYLQIIKQVRYLVASGTLQPGDELPPLRTLAEQLVINPNTVARAYRELARDGVVTQQRGSGTFVSDKGSPLAQEERVRIIEERLDALVAEAKQLGFSQAELARMLAARSAVLNGQLPDETLADADSRRKRKISG